MAPGDKSSRVIFIGNIPYGLTEEQIIHTFSNVGQVVSFRLVYDKDTGRPKGFGFMEFSDTDAAASAVRNLNDYEIMGRKLRVDYSNEGGANDAAPANYSGQQQQGQPQQPQAPPGGFDGHQKGPQTGLPPLPTGADLPPNLTCPDAISRTLSTLPAPQLLDILSQMKGLVMSDPNKATELLRQAPQLSYAIFQSLLLLGLVDTTVLASVVDQSQAAPQHRQQPQQPPPPPPPQPQQAQQMAFPAQQYPYQQQFAHQYLQMNAPTPPAQSLPYQMPHQEQQPQPGIIGEPLRSQILGMSQQQIDQLPPMERQQVLAARQQILSQRGF